MTDPNSGRAVRQFDRLLHPVEPTPAVSKEDPPAQDRVAEIWRQRCYPGIEHDLFHKCLADTTLEAWHGIREEIRAVTDLLAQATQRERTLVEAQLAAAQAESERDRLRLAACGHAAAANTEETRAQRLVPGHSYYSASYGDVCRAVDREMAHRERAERAEAELALLRRG